MRSFLRIAVIICLVMLVFGAPGIFASEPGHGDGDGVAAEHHDANIVHQMMLLAFQLGVIIISAKLCGELFSRVFRMPAVLGELAAGLVIGPYALGAVALPVIGPLFPLTQAAQTAADGTVIVPVSGIIYGISTVASILLLFLAGLETDFRQFMKYAGPGGLVGLGGVLGAFVTGDLLTLAFADVLGHPEWTFMSGVPMFLGTISVATSVGITARVLSEKGKLDTPEGVTILSGAVIDDVLGIIVLAVVIGLAKPGGTEVHWSAVAGKALGIFIVATVVMIALAKPMKRMFSWFKGDGVVSGVAFGIALILAGIMESANLAMIIGAYVSGLALAKEQDLAHRLDRQLRPMYNVLVPVFFCTMGMLVSFAAMKETLVFGLVFSLVAVVAKVVGCGLPTLLVRFNMRGALRVGFGMLPRGEVALIVAGVGLTQQVIQSDMFGVAIMMTLITTVLAPPILVKLFEGGSGVRGAVEPTVAHREVVWASKEFMPVRLATVVEGIIGAIREREGYDVTEIGGGGIYLVSSHDAADEFDFQVVRTEDRVEVHASAEDEDRALGLLSGALQKARSLWEDLAEQAPVTS
jgi:Na+:H+ antiporter